MKVLPSRRADYGIRALVYLANGDGRPAKAARIGTAMEMPIGPLQRVLQGLQRAGLVTSRSGPAGGYALARPAEQISVLEVIEALDGPIETSECALRGGPCRWEDVCALHWVWSAARRALGERLAGASLAQVAADDRALAEGGVDVPPDAHRARTRVPVPGGGRRR